MLLPWAAVGWLVGLTVRAAGRTRWVRDAALFALVVLTVGAVNATADRAHRAHPDPVARPRRLATVSTWRTAVVTTR